MNGLSASAAPSSLLVQCPPLIRLPSKRLNSICLSVRDLRQGDALAHLLCPHLRCGPGSACTPRSPERLATLICANILRTTPLLTHHLRLVSYMLARFSFSDLALFKVFVIAVGVHNVGDEVV